MQVTYCELWSNKRRAPTGTMSAEQARERDSKGESYCVVLGNPHAPDAVIDVVPKNSHIEVEFIDESGLTHTAYGFRDMGDGRFFNSTVTVWTYPEGARGKHHARITESIEMKPDGFLHREVRDKSAGNTDITDYSDVPVDVNWEPAPEFGHWESIARYDRDTPAEQS